MTPEQILAAIAASPALQALAAPGVRNDGEIARLLSVGFDPSRTVEVAAWRLQRYLIKRGKWRAILAASEDPAHPAHPAAVAAVDMASAAGMQIDLADPSPETQGMLAMLVGHGLISAADRDEMRDWCRAPLTVSVDAVSAALNGA